MKITIEVTFTDEETNFDPGDEKIVSEEFVEDMKIAIDDLDQKYVYSSSLWRGMQWDVKTTEIDLNHENPNPRNSELD